MWVNPAGAPINVLNLFTGQISSWEIPVVLEIILQIPLTLYGGFMSLFFPDYASQPLWACFLIGSMILLFLGFIASRIGYFIKTLIGLDG